MYFPILRGRQYELIALRELAENDILGDKVIPIIEPVKLSATLVKTYKAFMQKDKAIAIIQNPSVGIFNKEYKDEKNEKLKDAFVEVLNASNKLLYVRVIKANQNGNIEKFLDRHHEHMMTICTDKDALYTFQEVERLSESRYNLIPDETGFRRRVRYNRVLLADKFNKLERNDKYAGRDEPFSEDHIFYKEDGYKGFSDYSIVGAEYIESGFAPRAVAIHIVYEAEDKSLRIKHFVSDSNDDISDPAGKFHEAVKKLVEWNKNMKIKTLGMSKLEELYYSEVYPGLGVVKKLSIMHHIELVNEILGRE